MARAKASSSTQAATAEAGLVVTRNPRIIPNATASMVHQIHAGAHFLPDKWCPSSDLVTPVKVRARGKG